MTAPAPHRDRPASRETHGSHPAARWLLVLLLSIPCMLAPQAVTAQGQQLEAADDSAIPLGIEAMTSLVLDYLGAGTRSAR